MGLRVTPGLGLTLLQEKAPPPPPGLHSRGQAGLVHRPLLGGQRVTKDLPCSAVKDKAESITDRVLLRTGSWVAESRAPSWSFRLSSRGSLGGHSFSEEENDFQNQDQSPDALLTLTVPPLPTPAILSDSTENCSFINTSMVAHIVITFLSFT